MQDPRDGYTQGLTLRVGRHMAGTSKIFADILADLASRRRKGLLLVGAPGLGKTTLLRYITEAPPMYNLLVCNSALSLSE